MRRIARTLSAHGWGLVLTAAMTFGGVCLILWG